MGLNVGHPASSHLSLVRALLIPMQQNLSNQYLSPESSGMVGATTAITTITTKTTITTMFPPDWANTQKVKIRSYFPLNTCGGEILTILYKTVVNKYNTGNVHI